MKRRHYFRRRRSPVDSSSSLSTFLSCKLGKEWRCVRKNLFLFSYI
jgi:hypothetical protein